MKAGYDGSITISTSIDTSGFRADAKSLERAAQSTGRTIEKQTSSGKSGTKSAASSITGSLGSIKGALGAVAAAAAAAFSVKAIASFGKTCVSAASEMQSALMGLSSIMEGQGRSFSEAQQFINSYTADGLVPATNAINAYKNLALRGYDDSQIQQTMNALKDSAAFGRQASYTLGEAVETATEGLKNENSILVDNAGVTKNVAKMWDEYAASIGTTSNNLTQSQKVQAEVAGILEESKYQAGDAAKATSTYSGQMQQLSASFANLKVAIGNGIMPIVQSVLPWLNTIISALTKVANLFAQVMSALFGKAATQQKSVASSAVSATKAENNLAKATTKAGNATEKAGKQAKKSLAGFDELNILAENTADSMSSVADDVGTVADTSGVTGGNLGEGYSLDIEVSPKVQEFVDRLKKKLAELQPYVDQVSEAWENLKEAFENFISAPGVQKVLKFLKDLWSQLAERALAALMLALAGAVNVLAGALNIICGILDVVVGLFTGDFTMAANGAKTVVEGLKEIIQGFGQIVEAVLVVLLGKDCVETLKTVAKAMLEELGNAIGGTEDIITALKTILNGLITFVTGIFSGNWKKAWEGVKQIFKGIMDGVYAVAKAAINLVISCINTMIDAIASGLNWIINKINKLSFTVPSWVPGIGGKEFGFNLPKVTNPVKIPMLATGAVIPPNSQFLAVLGDQSSGRNLEAPESLIRQIVREETGTGNVYIEAGGDMGQLIRLLRFELKKADRLGGTSLVNGV